MRRNIARIIRMAALAAMLCCAFQAAEAETWYAENDLNYLDISMDTEHGIPEDADGDLGRIKRSGILRVAADFECPPMNFLDPEAAGNLQYAGADMELARLLARRMGVELVIVPQDALLKLPALIEDLCDLTISAIPYGPGTALSYTLSNAYYYPEQDMNIGILIREDEEIHSLKDLASMTIAAQSNSIEEVFATTVIDHYMEFRRPASARKVFEMVMNGTADAGIVSVSVADVFFAYNADSGLRLVRAEELADPAENRDMSLSSRYFGYRVAAKKGENQLIAFVNGVIDEAVNGKLIDRWKQEAETRAEELGLTVQ